jgi:hypothetical protein
MFPIFGLNVPCFGLNVPCFGLNVPCFGLNVPYFVLNVPCFGLTSLFCSERGASVHLVQVPENVYNMRLLFSDGGDRFDKSDDGQDYTLVPAFAPTKEECEAAIEKEIQRQAITKQAEVNKKQKQRRFRVYLVPRVVRVLKARLQPVADGQGLTITIYCSNLAEHSKCGSILKPKCTSNGGASPV